MKFEITQGETSDIEAIAQFQVEMALETENILLDQNIVLNGVRAAIEDESKGKYFVAKANGKTIGSMMLTMEWSDWHAGWYWWIQSVYVIPQYRGIGAFSTMYQTLREKAKESNVSQLRLYVENTNLKAQARYEKAGMRRSHYLMYEEDC